MSGEAISAIKTLGQRFSQSFPAFKTTLWQWKFDIVLLLSSAVCFGLFLERSINLDQMSGIGGPIAILVRGNAEKKAAGTNLFIEIGPNTNLYNLDVIWVPKDNEASIQL